MANHKSALKRIKQSAKSNLKNRASKSQMRTAIKDFENVIATGSKDDALKSFRLAQKTIAITAQKGIIKKNAGSRYISRLAGMLNSKSA